MAFDAQCSNVGANPLGHDSIILLFWRLSWACFAFPENMLAKHCKRSTFEMINGQNMCLWCSFRIANKDAPHSLGYNLSFCRRQFGGECTSQCLGRRFVHDEMLSLRLEFCYLNIIEWQLKQESFPFWPLCVWKIKPHFAKWPWGILLCSGFNFIAWETSVIRYFLSVDVYLLLFQTLNI